MQNEKGLKKREKFFCPHFFEPNIHGPFMPIFGVLFLFFPGIFFSFVIFDRFGLDLSEGQKVKGPGPGRRWLQVRPGRSPGRAGGYVLLC